MSHTEELQIIYKYSLLQKWEVISPCHKCGLHLAICFQKIWYGKKKM